MAKQYQITGLGPLTGDGGRKIFTVLPNPFMVSSAWLSEQSKEPAVGDVLEMNDHGGLTLVTETQAATDAADETPLPDGTQKKSPSSSASGSGLSVSPFREYQGLPVVVYAAPITEVVAKDDEGNFAIHFADGSLKIATKAMTARMKPLVGDYWVVSSQGDGVYEYLNPKAVFEAKYKLTE